jgi:hypothetical protein
MRGIKDGKANLCASQLLDNVDDPTNARAALSLAFDSPQVQDLRVYSIGDGEALSGILVAGLHRKTDCIFLVYLMD